MLSGRDLKLKYNTYLLKHRDKHGMKRMRYRDTEQGKVYKSEWALADRMLRKSGDLYGKTKFKRFETVEEAQKFVNKVTSSATWKKNFPLSGKILVAPMARSGGRTQGRAQWGLIEVNTSNGLNSYVMLHELAHCAGAMHHGRVFRNNLLILVGAFIGSAAKKALKEEFKKRKLRIGDAPKPRSYESWVKSYKRMEIIREKKMVLEEK